MFYTLTVLLSDVLFLLRFPAHFLEIILRQAFLCENGMQHRNITGHIPCRILKNRIQQLFKGNVQGI